MGRSYRVYSWKLVHPQLCCVMKCLVFFPRVMMSSQYSIIILCIVSGPVSSSVWNFGFSWNSIACGKQTAGVSMVPKCLVAC